MIRFLQHEVIDKMRWDDCISNAVNGNLVAYSWYLDIVSPGWCALVENEYDKVFPLTVSSRAGIKYIMQPYFIQQLGLFYKSILPDGKLQEFINCIPSDYKYIDINLNSANKLPDNGHVSNMTNLELDMSSEYRFIAKGYQNNLQRNLKKANQNKLSIVKQVRPEEIILLFRANKGQDLYHLDEKQYTLLQRIAYESIHKGIGEIWGAYDEFNQLVAGVLWVRSHQKTIFLFSALSESGRNLHAMPWLIDVFIRQNAGKPVKLDFEGSNNEGLARFYGSFGAKREIYQRYVRNSLPLSLSVLLKFWRLSRQTLNKYFSFSKKQIKVLNFVR
ncbi:MAG: hypothetical protein WC780_12080 [Lentimicrobiaceae bacterium]|jgi:hypothetical protein